MDATRKSDGYRGRRVLVLGLARSGIAAARLLARGGAAVRAADECGDLDIPADLGGAEVVLGEFGGRLLDGIDEVVLSPGIRSDHPLVTAARGAQIEVIGELELGFRFAEARVVAVTGTNGKSTTVSMIGAILRESGHETIVAGNVGLPFCSVATDLGPDGIYVIEVSSFQLEAIADFRPAVAGLLNLTPDHLDRYRDMDEYIAAKARILANMRGDDLFFYNALDEKCAALARSFGGRSVPFSSAGPVTPGVYLEQGMIVRDWNGVKERLMRAEEIGVVGLHNVENSLAAVASLLPFGIPAEDCASALARFEGLPHRMEKVAEIDGVAYFNDSKATNVEATVMSLKGIESSVVLIAGGKDKGSDFTLLLPVLGKVKEIVTIGKAAPLIERAIGGVVPMRRAATMEEAVEAAARAAAGEGIVLLSPACASFDMFDNFEHRGEVFRECVRRLQKAVG